MPLVSPPTTKSLGQKSVVILTTPPAAATGIPTLTEANAGVFASLHIVGDFDVTPTQNTGEGPRAMGAQTSPTELGLVSYPAVSAQYFVNPQALATPGAPGNEVWEALEPGTQVTVLVLNGFDGTSDTLAAGDVADIFLMECGIRAKGATGDDEFAKVAATSQLIVVGGAPVAENYPLTAA